MRSDPPNKALAGKLHPTGVLQAWLAVLAREKRDSRATDSFDQANTVLQTGLRHSEVRRLQADWIEPVPPSVAAVHPVSWLGCFESLRTAARAARSASWGSPARSTLA